MRRLPFRLPKFPPTVWLIGIISLMNDTAGEMLYPLLPLYLASVLMSGPKALGLIEGVAEATSSLFKLFSGASVDRKGNPKVWMFAGYSMAAISRPLIGLAGSWPIVMVLRFSDRMGKGFRSAPRDALLAASVAPERRGFAFGFHRAMDNAGAVIGPLLAVLFLKLGWSLQHIFFLAIIPGAITLILVSFLKDPIASPQEKKTPFSWRMVGMPLPFKRYLVSLGLFTLGNSSNMFLLLRAKELGLSASSVPFAWAAVSWVAMVFTAPISSLSDRYPRHRLILAGWIAYAGFYAIMAWLGPSRPYVIFLVFGGYGLFFAATEGVEKALVADLAPKALVGTAFGWFHLVSGGMLLPASLFFGLLYDRFGPAIAFGFSASCAALAAVLLMTWVRLPKIKSA